VAAMMFAAQAVADHPAAVAEAGKPLPEPKLLKRKTPDYPDDALRAGLGGMVIVEATVDEKGAVTDARSLHGAPPLDQAAVKAVKQWRYAPLVVDGKPKKFVLTVTLNFNRGFRFDLDALLKSLHSENPYIRESAVRWLGRARSSRNLDIGTTAEIRRRVQRVAETDESELVRAAATKALAELEAR
jgi:TonB family protein